LAGLTTEAPSHRILAQGHSGDARQASLADIFRKIKPSRNTATSTAGGLIGSEMMDFETDIMETRSGKKTGHVKVRLSFVADQRSLIVVSCECTGLKNAEFGLGGKNDVYVVYDWSHANKQTKTLDNAGQAALFQDPVVVTPGSTVLLGSEFKVYVYDDNTGRSDVIIGHGVVDVGALLQKSLPTPVTLGPAEYAVDIVDGKGNKSGHVSLRVHPAAFERRSVSLLRISCSGLKSVEMFGKNDVYVLLEWCGIRYKSPIHDNAGAATVFNEEIAMTPAASMPLTPKIHVAVFDENSVSSDTLIGSGDVDIAVVAQAIA
jgi:hypothetical protein